MSVNISHNDTLHAYFVSSTMPVQHLMEEISEKQFLYQFKLKHGNTELLNESPVSNYITTLFSLCYDDKEVFVTINDITFEVNMTNLDKTATWRDYASSEMTVGQLKERISKHFISTRANWVLKKKGKPLPEKYLIRSYMDKKTFTIDFEDMTVNLRTSNGTISIQTRYDMAILELKEICAEKTEMRMNQFNLYFKGKELETHVEMNFFSAFFLRLLGAGVQQKKRTLESYRIEPLAEIVLAK